MRDGALADGLHPPGPGGQAMRNLIIWNVVVAAVLGGVYGALVLLLSRMPRTDAALLRETLMGMKRADDEHACWAARTMYHYLPQLPDEARRDLTRALFTS